MNLPDDDLLKVLTCAHTGFSVAEILEHAPEVAVRMAAHLGLVEVRHPGGERISVGWALDQSRGEQQQTFTVHLTDAGTARLQGTLAPPPDVLPVLTAAAGGVPLADLVREEGRRLVQDAADSGLIRLDGTAAGWRWALYRADPVTQQTLSVHLTDAGRDYLRSV